MASRTPIYSCSLSLCVLLMCLTTSFCSYGNFSPNKEESASLVVFWDGRYIWLEAIKAFDLNDAV